MGTIDRNLASSKVLEDVFDTLSVRLVGAQWQLIRDRCNWLKRLFRHRCDELSNGRLGAVYKTKKDCKWHKLTHLGFLDSPDGPMLVFRTRVGRFSFSKWVSQETATIQLSTDADDPTKLKIQWPTPKGQHTKDFFFETEAERVKFMNQLLYRGANRAVPA